MKTGGICLTFIYLASLGGYIAVVLECGQCLVFYGDLMDDGFLKPQTVTNATCVSKRIFLKRLLKVL
jgi:hypothetical protein